MQQLEREIRQLQEERNKVDGERKKLDEISDLEREVKAGEVAVQKTQKEVEAWSRIRKALTDGTPEDLRAAKEAVQQLLNENEAILQLQRDRLRKARIAGTSADIKAAEEAVQKALNQREELRVVQREFTGKTAEGTKHTSTDVRLNNQKIAPVTAIGVPPSPVVRQHLMQMRRDGVQLLSCVYGPIDANGTGFKGDFFWYQRVPITQQELLAIDRNHPLARLGDTAFQACPATLTAAQNRNPLRK